MKSTFQGPIIDSVVSVINPSGQAGSAVTTISAGSLAIGSVITVDTKVKRLEEMTK